MAREYVKKDNMLSKEIRYKKTEGKEEKED